MNLRLESMKLIPMMFHPGEPDFYGQVMPVPVTMDKRTVSVLSLLDLISVNRILL